MPKINTRAALVCGATIVASVAMAASADTLATLGGAVGWGAKMRWSLPVSVDVLALVSGLVWLAAGVPLKARSLGQWLTLVTVIGSVVLNAVGHLVSTDHIVVGPFLVIAVSAVPPLAAALAVHLAATTAQGGHGPQTDTPPVPPRTVADTIPAQSDAPRVPVRIPADTATDTADADDTARAGIDTAALPLDTIPAAADTLPVPYSAPADTETVRPTYKLDTFAERYVPADAELTDPGTARPLAMPETGSRLTEAELDAVVVLLARETDPPRSYRQMEDRFRELGYSASAARLRAAWQRAAVTA